jgi:carboxymethylenebutenolidase
MTRRKASDYDPRVLELFDKYVHGGLSRRDFLDRAAAVAAGGAAASTLLADYALAQEVPEGDPRISTARIEYQSPRGYGAVKGLLARPAKATGKLPGVLVVHENRGLNPYIEDVARRLGAEGYLALAPDGLTSLGGYPGNDDEGRAMQAKLDRNKMLEDFIAGVEHLQSHADCTGKVGAVGFCFGGGICNALAVRVASLNASVPFYGSQPPAEDVPKIQAPLCLHYAENDERIDAGWPAYEEALEANGKTFEVYFYPGTSHGFHNYSTPRYDEAAAKLAWGRTLAFYKKYLS